MNRFDALKRWTWSVFIVFTLAFAFAGCEGDDGAQGPAGSQGPAGPPGADGTDGTDATTDPVAAAAVESCATCHGGVGVDHQSIYDTYVAGIDPGASAFDMTFTNFTATPGAVLGEFDGTLQVTILKNGVPFEDFALLDQAYFAVVNYDGPNQDYSAGRQELDVVTQPTPGNYVISGTGLSFDPTVSGQVYGYIAQGILLQHEGSAGSELPAGTHVHLYDDIANAALAFGDAAVGAANEYVSAANVEGCQKCHGTPYAKHGYRAAEVDGLPDFAACKTCHYSGRNGFVTDWQFRVDDPLGWATGGTPPADYTYEGSIMNDTHMSHAMEFPYPQTMQNCATCHEGKLTTVLADEQFTAETCLSCHAREGVNAKPGEVYAEPNRAPALAYLWAEAGVEGFHTFDANCQGCHTAAAGVASQFTAYHTGYDVNITDPSGVRYTDAYTVAIDAASYDPVSGLITVDFSSSDPAIVPELYISFYGWDSKHFIAAGHERDGNEACSGFRPGCQMEYTPESSGGSANPIFTEDAASAPGDWRVVADPSQWQLSKTDDIPTMIADGIIRRIEVMLAPELNLADLATPGPDLDVVLEGVTKTLNLATGLTEDDYFKGANAVVSTEKCNVCHDVLASSFHSESGRGGDGIILCKNCHNPTYAGSHLEMASRSIDSYVHAIHSFQDFDVGDTFEAFDPVFAKRYDQHINHTFPNFTIRNCEACHVTPEEGNGAVVYNVPDQAKSMPGLLSGSDEVLTWYDIAGGVATEDPSGRNIGTVPQYVTGAASRACGGCHRADLINADLAGDLAAFNAHTEAFGTLVENSEPDDAVLYGVIDKIMSLFE